MSQRVQFCLSTRTASTVLGNKLRRLSEKICSFKEKIRLICFNVGRKKYDKYVGKSVSLLHRLPLKSMFRKEQAVIFVFIDLIDIGSFETSNSSLFER